MTFIDEGKHGPHSYLIMQLAGPSLSELRRNSKNRCFTTSTTCRMGVQSLEAIESVHISGLLHRDIKPANFAIGKSGNEKRILFMLDFGLVRKYIVRGKIRPPRSSAGFRGETGLKKYSILFHSCYILLQVV